MTRWVPLALVLVLAPFVFLAVVGALPGDQGFVDLNVYRAGGLLWRTGQPLYDGQFPRILVDQTLVFTYPPLSAMLFAPVSLLTMTAAKVLLTVLSIAAIAVTVAIVGRERALSVTAILALGAVVVVFEPFRQNFVFGQVNTILMALVVADCLLPRTWWPRGMLVGLAAAIKLTPAVFVLYFVARRQWREAVVSVVSGVGFAGLVALLDPHDSARYWTHTLWDSGRIGELPYAYNQSMNAVLYRLGLGDGPRTVLWGLSCLVVVGLGYLAARRAEDKLTALLVVADVGLLCSPVSWSHHWVWIIAAVPVLLAWHRVWGVVVLLVFVVGPHGLMPNLHYAELNWSWWQHLAGNAYVWIGLAFLLVTALRKPSTKL